MKYKVGDRVKIKSLDWYNKNKDEDGNIELPTHIFISEMSQFCGKVVTIADVFEDTEGNVVYYMEEVDFDWTDEMIEGLVEEKMYGLDTDLERERFHKECSESHIRDGYWLLAMLFATLDKEPKNHQIFGRQDDTDTIQGMPNFLKGNYAVNVGKKEYMGYIYDEFIKVPEDGYYVYDFALVNNGKVIAIGDEQGRCGGVYCSCRDKNFEDWLKKSPVYDKVKHLPIATSEELEEPIYKYFNSHDEYEKYMAKTSKGDGNK